ncbi:uncharacterized protein DUF1127 [Rhizobium azibense]|uniref:Uncharacterized protein DUF1127 n=2 Tax=Rhizobium azibense TaxID=1136135 RepID=A0A4R3RUH8_9HYPH|nr:uncharacterized protein DUF1127 [Rhizobium azibense]
MNAPGRIIMREVQVIVAEALPATVDELYRKFGVWRTARALVLAAWRHHQTVSQVSQLSDRMRRDIGLPEAEHAHSAERYWSIWPDTR